MNKIENIKCWQLDEPELSYSNGGGVIWYSHLENYLTIYTIREPVYNLSNPILGILNRMYMCICQNSYPRMFFETLFISATNQKLYECPIVNE